MCPAPTNEFSGSLAYAQLYSAGGSIPTIQSREWNPIKIPAEVYDPAEQGRLNHNIDPYGGGVIDQFGFKVRQEGLYRVMFSCSYSGGYVAADDNIFWSVCKNTTVFGGAASNLPAPDMDTVIYVDTFTRISQMNLQGVINLSPDDFITFVLDIKTSWTTALTLGFMHLTVYNLDQLGVK